MTNPYRLMLIKTALALAIIHAMASVALAELPFPAAAAGQLYLPFGLKLYETGQREKIIGYGNPDCAENSCQWVVEKKEGTVFLIQTYHRDTLKSFQLTYILAKDAGLVYREKLRALKKKLSEWVITGPRDILTPPENFRAESKDVVLESKYREGEHSVTVSLVIRAK